MIPEVTAAGEIVAGRCPKCKAKSVLRYSYKNMHYFVGCSRFPECRHVVSADPDALGRAMSITIDMLPGLLSVINTPEFLRGEPDTVNAVFDLAQEIGEVFVNEMGLENALLLGKDIMRIESYKKILREYSASGRVT